MRILLLEDEEAIRGFVRINLKRNGMDVTEAEDGETALMLANEADPPFDVALLDVMLPTISGFDVCEQLRERFPRMGIIMLTAKSQEEDKIRGLELGADDYVQKPFSPGELIARLGALHRRMMPGGLSWPEPEESGEAAGSGVQSGSAENTESAETAGHGAAEGQATVKAVDISEIPRRSDSGSGEWSAGDAKPADDVSRSSFGAGADKEGASTGGLAGGDSGSDGFASPSSGGSGFSEAVFIGAGEAETVFAADARAGLEGFGRPRTEQASPEQRRLPGDLHEGMFRLSSAERRLWKGTEEVVLTPTEWTLVKLLMERAGEGLSRDDILDAVWGRHFIGDLKIVDVNIRRIRQKIENEPSDPRFIETLWGYGYRWKRSDGQ